MQSRCGQHTLAAVQQGQAGPWHHITPLPVLEAVAQHLSSLSSSSVTSSIRAVHPKGLGEAQVQQG
jgi:hypothetical protein